MASAHVASFEVRPCRLAEVAYPIRLAIVWNIHTVVVDRHHDSAAEITGAHFALVYTSFALDPEAPEVLVPVDSYPC
jgi:hypothetical protein